MARDTREIDWGSAQVQDGTLTVTLSGARSKAWSARFEGVLALLARTHTSWGKVSLAKKAIRVTGLTPGTETDLRHFLESIVLEANSAVEPDARPPGDEANAAPESEVDPEERMAATFRAFASESTSPPEHDDF